MSIMGDPKTQKQPAHKTLPHVAVVDVVGNDVVIWAVALDRPPRATGAWVLDRESRWDDIESVLRDRWVMPIDADPDVVSLSERGVVVSWDLTPISAYLPPFAIGTPAPTLDQLEATPAGDPRTARALGMARWLERVASGRDMPEPVSEPSAPVTAPVSASTAPARTSSTGMTFATIDVEIANRDHGSVCAFGVTLVDDGRVVTTESWLVRPPEGLDTFDGFYTSIHGIRAEDVKDAMPFREGLARALDLIGDRIVVAHNAAFDIGALRQACVADGAAWPTLDYVCSLVMCRRHLGLISNRLPIVCDHLGIEMGNHHDAGEDSLACANVVLALGRRLEVDDVEGLCQALMIRPGRLTAFDWTGSYVRDAARTLPEANVDADPNHPLYGKVVAFTGGLSILRREAWELVAARGGIPAKNVTKDTDFLVIGDGFTGNSPEEFHTGRAMRAVHWNAKGRSIEVLTEADLYSLLVESVTGGVRAAVTEAR
jgi:DNA polymerase-3 subunit epsilon